jgi:hypothetical protein
VPWLDLKLIDHLLAQAEMRPGSRGALLRNTRAAIVHARPAAGPRGQQFLDKIEHFIYLASETRVEDDAAPILTQARKVVANLAIEAVSEIGLEDTIRAEDRIAQFKKTSKAGNQRKRSLANDRQTEWQAEADMIWRRRPELSKAAVAKLVAKSCGGNPDYIRQRLKK